MVHSHSRASSSGKNNRLLDRQSSTPGIMPSITCPGSLSPSPLTQSSSTSASSLLSYHHRSIPSISPSSLASSPTAATQIYPYATLSTASNTTNSNLNLDQHTITINPSTCPNPKAGFPSMDTSSSSSSSARTDQSTPRSTTPSSATGSSSDHKMAPFNPLTSVDVGAIEDAMKHSSLDQLRGYSRNSFGEVKTSRSIEHVDEEQAPGYHIIREPHWNKGMYFLSSKIFHYFYFTFQLLCFRFCFINPSYVRIVNETHHLHAIQASHSLLKSALRRISLA